MRSIGAEGDFQIDDGVLTVYLGDGGEVEIPDGVEEIGTSAFQNCSGLTKVTVPASVKKIGEYAFSECDDLTEIVFAEGLETIGANAFYGCESLAGLEFPDTLVSVGNAAFAQCTGLADISFGKGLKTVGENAFNGCSGLESLELPEGLESIGYSAFYQCTGMAGGLVIPASVQVIGDRAFYGCTGLDGKLVIEGGEKSVGNYAFRDCSGLTGLELGEGIRSIGNSAFYYCTGLTGELELPEGLESIGDSAFYQCAGLTGELVLPESLTGLGNSAFYGCSGFAGELVVPDQITVLPSGVFGLMEGITSITIGAGVTEISTGYGSNQAFYGMGGVTEVTFTGLTVPEVSSRSYGPFVPLSALETVYVPAEAYDAYVDAYGNTVDDSVVFSTDNIRSKVKNLAVSNIYSRTVVLKWNAHTNDRVIGYTVERDGEVVGNTTECGFTERNLTMNKVYTYSVYGYTASGETTGVAKIDVRTPAPNITSIRTDNSSNKIGLKNTLYVYIADNKNMDPLGDEEAEVNLYYLDGDKKILIGEARRNYSLGNSSNAVYTADWDITALEDGEYEVLASVTDIDGAYDEYSEIISIDRSVPEQIVGVIAVGDIDVIHLNWAISAEADTKAYRIYRRAEGDEVFRLVAQINDRNTLTYTDDNVKSDRIYYYYVTGVNEFGQEGPASETAGATLSRDMEIPVVTKLSPVSGGYLSGEVTIGLTAEDNVFVTQAELYYSVDNGENWTKFGEAGKGSLTAELDTTKFDDGKIQIKGLAYDAAGNVSAPLVYAYMIDNTGPSQVKGLSYESTNVSVTLKWENVPDEDIYYYRVEQKTNDGTYKKIQDVYNTLGVNIYDLKPDTIYIYRVVGYDQQGNRGIPSDDIAILTLNDTTAPVITRIRPLSGYYSDSIDLSVTADDEHSISSIALQVSTDGVEWDTVHTETYTDDSRTQTVSYELELGKYPEGNLFVRAVAKDSAGNTSSTGRDAPFVQHIIDRSAPKAPENAAAEGKNGYIEVSWTQGSETDLNTYSVYRSDAEDGEYKLLKEGLKTINYIDREAEEGTVYYYKVKVDDIAGNESGFSDVVSAEVIRDTEVPTITSVYPETGERIGAGYKTVSVLAEDNNALASILIEYSADGAEYTKLAEFTDLGNYYETVTADVPVEEFGHGDTAYIRITAADRSGNESQPVVNEYTVDTAAPTVLNAAAVYEEESESINISWESGLEDDLSGYRIYRKAGADGAYSLIAQRQAAEGQSGYSCTDYNFPAEKAVYFYKIEAVDDCGNTFSAVTAETAVPDRSMPEPVISCDTTMEVGVEYYIDAGGSTDDSGIVSYLFDFGDGTTSTEKKTVHKYSETGEYTITLTVTDENGNEASCEKRVTVKERAAIGTARIRVVDENGSAVAGAPVYFDLGEEEQVIKVTDSSGYAVFTAEAGRHTVGSVIADNEWLPVKKDIIVTAGNETDVSLILVHHVMVEGSFEINRMTFDEIVAAGIDVSDPENQYIVEVNVTLTYGAETVETSFTYNGTTGKTNGKPIIVSTDGGNREIVPVVLKPIGGGGHGSGVSGDYVFSEEPSIAFLDIPISASSLKEFFDVNLHIINNASSEFSMLENTVNLNVPAGLTLMDTYVSESSANVSIAEIKGQTTETISWILRGDEVGEYYLSADYSGILSQFNEPIYTQFIATEPIQVYGMSNLKLTVDIPEELDHGTFYYNTSLTNEGKIDVYRPRLDTEDILIETQLFDASGADITDMMGLNAEEVHEFELAESIEGELDVLAPGNRLTRHYMCVDQTLYTEQKQKLINYAYEVGNTYGLEIEIIERPLSYFKSSLSTNINAQEKADLTFTTNQSAYDYLMTNENYIYWSLYASTGEVESALTTNTQETLWNLLKFAAGDGDFKALFGADDEELIQAIILDTMEISIESEDYSKYFKMLDWTTLVKDWLFGEGSGEWADIVTKWAGKYASKLTESQLSKLIEDIGKSLPQTFEWIATEYKWEAYKAVYEGEYLDFDNFIIAKWQAVIETYYLETTEWYTETDASKMLHELFSKEGFEKIWEGIGIGVSTAKKIVAVFEDSAADVSMYLAAQSTLDSCNLFLDTLIDYLSGESGDAKKVADAAVKIKDKINELDLVGKVADNLLDEAFWMGVDYVKDKAMAKLNITPGPLITTIKIALKLTVYVGDNVFNVSERHDIADNIRFVSCMTIALRNGIRSARSGYLNDRSDNTAQKYMQLISYLLNLRAIGESQVALFGVSYEVLPGVIDSSQLFRTVRDMSGAAEAESWYEWRDFVEDKISMLRVQLLKNPLASEASGLTAPVVTFDYVNGQTAQTFSSEYEYSLNGGATWTACDGTAISVDMQHYSVELLVRRVDYEGTNEKMTGSVTIYGPPSLSGSSIRVLQTENGYRIENLDNSREYEVSFAQEPQSYQYGETLDIEVPDGSYSYEFTTDREYGYVYVRSVADPNRYASYVYSPVIYPMHTVTLENDGDGMMSGGGRYEYGEEASLVATPSENTEFAGWYSGGELISKEPVYTFTVYEDWNITGKFVWKPDDWVIDTGKGVVTGILEGTPPEDVISYFEEQYGAVSITGPDGEEVDKIGTGCLLSVNGISYEIVVMGDVNGDAGVDVFDTDTMIEYINHRAELTGVYYDAGCVRGDEELDMFDVYSVINYIQTGEFSQ